MTAEIKLGTGWSVNNQPDKDVGPVLQIGQVVQLVSPLQETVIVYNHSRGTWVGLPEEKGLNVQGQATIKSGGVNLHQPGACVQRGKEQDPDYIKVKHLG